MVGEDGFPVLPPMPEVSLDEMTMSAHLDIAVYVHEGDLCVTQGSGDSMEIIMIPMSYVDSFANAALSCAMRYKARKGLN